MGVFACTIKLNLAYSTHFKIRKLEEKLSLIDFSQRHYFYIKLLLFFFLHTFASSNYMSKL